jgi:hypothetical protein
MNAASKSLVEYLRPQDLQGTQATMVKRGKKPEVEEALMGNSSRAVRSRVRYYTIYTQGYHVDR